MVAAAVFASGVGRSHGSTNGSSTSRSGGGSSSSTTRLAGGGSSSTPTSSTTTLPLNDITLSAVGDTELGNTPMLPPNPYSYLSGVESALKAPIVFGNLEGTLTNYAYSPKCGTGSSECYAFRTPPYYARVLRDAGFTILNSANNHSYDYGPQGVTDTSAALKAAGIVQAGLLGQIGIVKDGNTKVAFCDFAPYTDVNDMLNFAAAKTLIDKAKTEASVVVVYMHAGAEGIDAAHVTGKEEYFLGEDRGNAEAFAHAAIDDGADLVIASGPHTLRGMQFYKGHLIAYSLGDFATYQDFSTAGTLEDSGILHVTLTGTGNFVSASWTSLLLTSEGQPYVDTSGQAAQLVNQLSVEDFGSAAAEIQPNGTITPVG
jgi:hypothetical protein